MQGAQDAHRFATRPGEWREQMTNLTLAELDADLDGLRMAGFSYSEQAVAASAFVDAAAERLAWLERGRS